ncbi:MAG: response regulator, partial [Patescibacteria group bacterium]
GMDLPPATTTQKFKQKILIITGDGSFGERLADVIRKGGYEVNLVKNGVEGVKTIYNTLPHLVLLDIVVPGTEGYEILAQKSKEPMLAKIPVFFMSTQGIPINMRRVPENSVAEFILALHSQSDYILERIDRYFNNERGKQQSQKSGMISAKEILWVEDDKLIGNILSKKFISSGFDLVFVKSGNEALERLKHTIPDIIIIDIVLPGMNGLDLLQKIRSDLQLKKVPILILSNLSKPSDIERARILGAQRFLVKAAVSLDQIVAEVRAMCEK